MLAEAKAYRLGGSLHAEGRQRECGVREVSRHVKGLVAHAFPDLPAPAAKCVAETFSARRDAAGIRGSGGRGRCCAACEGEMVRVCFSD